MEAKSSTVREAHGDRVILMVGEKEHISGEVENSCRLALRQLPHASGQSHLRAWWTPQGQRSGMMAARVHSSPLSAAAPLQAQKSTGLHRTSPLSIQVYQHLQGYQPALCAPDSPWFCPSPPLPCALGDCLLCIFWSGDHSLQVCTVAPDSSCNLTPSKPTGEPLLTEP